MNNMFVHNIKEKRTAGCWAKWLWVVTVAVRRRPTTAAWLLSLFSNAFPSLLLPFALCVWSFLKLKKQSIYLMFSWFRSFLRCVIIKCKLRRNVVLCTYVDRYIWLPTYRHSFFYNPLKLKLSPPPADQTHFKLQISSKPLQRQERTQEYKQQSNFHRCTWLLLYCMHLNTQRTNEQTTTFLLFHYSFYTD